MTTGTTPLLGLALPVQGELDGQWGNVVNYATTDYINIAIAGTLTFTGDGAITLANTTGDDISNNFNSTTAQYAVIKVTGTLTTTKIITGPSYSKTYIVDNAATGGTVTFKASGQTGVSVAVGEKCTVYYNGTDYVKVASSVADGVTSVSGTGTVNGITLTGTVTSTGSLTLGGTLSNVNLTSQVTGVLPVANGGTGTATPNLVAGSNISVTGTWPNQTIASTAGGTVTSVTGSGNIASSGGTTPNITFTGILPVANGGTATATPGLVAGSNVTVSGTWPNQTIAAVGGGGTTVGIYPAIASGALANGDKVVINSDGTVSVAAIPSPSAAASSTIVSTITSDTCATYDTTNNKVVVAYASGGGKAAVGTVSGTSISWGTPVSFSSNSVNNISIAFDSVNGKVVIAYNDATTDFGTAVVGTVSGTSISFGTAVTFQAGTEVRHTSTVYDSGNGKIVISYRDYTVLSGKSIVGTVSGTSISFGTAVTFAAAADYISSTYTGTKVVVAYYVSTTVSQAIVGTVSGTSISFGTASTFTTTSTNPYGIVTTYDTTNAKVIIAYGGFSASAAVVGTVSGTTISFGTPVVFGIPAVSDFAITYSPYANKIVIGWGESSAPQYAYMVSGEVSGTSILFSASAAVNSVSTDYLALTYDPTAQKPIFAYYAGPGGSLRAQVITVGSTNLTATNFIGISDAAYANGATATIQTVGSTDDAQSGLTAGLAYYVQTNGTLASTAGSPSVFAGTAVSATKLIIKG